MADETSPLVQALMGNGRDPDEIDWRKLGYIKSIGAMAPGFSVNDLTPRESQNVWDKRGLAPLDPNAASVSRMQFLSPTGAGYLTTEPLRAPGALDIIKGWFGAGPRKDEDILPGPRM